MQLHQTTISERDGKLVVEMLIADNTDTNLASERLNLRVNVELGDQTAPHLAAIQKAALQRARVVIGEQIRAMQDTLDQAED